ncbi:nucleotidyltransferase family protein [Sphingorhabdus sp. Alg231-15]|uniref:nucleotidyltransferase family protein n=1 Tax=Sphingorhabdus sp. Alg231-15 TaxID=1922222 RepID=UPI000D54FFC2
MSDALRIEAILRSDPVRWHLLGVVAELALPDCWIGAGFVRNAVWDSLHGRAPGPLLGDIDVIWFDPDHSDAERDRNIEETLRAAAPSVDWSVKNQARMHLRNGDAPYLSATDAMRYWPETATAVAARRHNSDQCEVASPLGLDDLFDLILRPTGRFVVEKRNIYDERIQSKDWIGKWSLLKNATP